MGYNVPMIMKPAINDGFLHFDRPTDNIRGHALL